MVTDAAIHRLTSPLYKSLVRAELDRLCVQKWAQYFIPRGGGGELLDFWNEGARVFSSVVCDLVPRGTLKIFSGDVPVFRFQ